jgi:hypothetical protein
MGIATRGVSVWVSEPFKTTKSRRKEKAPLAKREQGREVSNRLRAIFEEPGSEEPPAARVLE